MDKKQTESRGWAITIHQWTAETLQGLKDAPWIKWGILGQEVCPKTTKLHQQGYLKTVRALGFQRMLKKLNKLGLMCHLEMAYASLEKNEDYCKKDLDWVEWGDKQTYQGKRTDFERIMDRVDEGATLEEIRAEFPGQYYRNGRWIEEDILKRVIIKKGLAARKEMINVTLREWQETALKSLLTQGIRTILWIVDYTGNEGKTWFAKYLKYRHGAFRIKGGRMIDIAHAFNLEEIVVFDFQREQREMINYALIECFKDGVIFAGKYMSKEKEFPACGVICLANWPPYKHRLSLDRWDIVFLNEPTVEGFDFID